MNNKSDYGLLLIAELSSTGDFIPLSRLVEKTHLPQRFIARIASDLVKNGILKSKEGKIGGYKLAKDLRKVNFLEFLQVFEKDSFLVKCEDPSYQCNFESLCTHKLSFRKRINNILSRELHKWTLADIFSQKYIP